MQVLVLKSIFWQHLRTETHRFLRAAFLLLIWLLVLLLPYKFAMATETPRYAVIASQDDIEIRRYEPRIIAEVLVDGELDTASGRGFRILADYIFGNNRINTDQPISISADTSTKIAMTAPVSIEPRDDQPTMTDARQWRVEFTMPAQYTLETLPRPTNPAIQIRLIPGRLVAALRYSGMNTQNRIDVETTRLQDWIRQNPYSPVGAPELARYNPPWTLPMFRRNEILIPVKEVS